MCGSNLREFIFQAKVLSTAEKTSDQFRDELLQKWVNEKPIVMIEGQMFQVDPYCTVELTDLRSTYCRSESPTVAMSQNSTKTSLAFAIEITAGVGGGLFACILVACAVVIALCCCTRKSVKRKYHEPRREGLDIQ